MKKIITNNFTLLLIIFIGSFLTLYTFTFDNNVHIPESYFYQEENEPENPDERIKQRVMIRADENGYIPMDGIIKAKEQRDQLLRATSSKDINDNTINDGGIRGWEWLGPGNIGGRIRAILIDPDNSKRIWIGSVSGGIWVTENGGDYWNPVNDFMANLAITSLVMDPTNKNIMYAATGEGFNNADGLPGAGIFRSTDRGQTWKLLPSTNVWDFRYITRLAHHPNNYHDIFAATWKGIFHSINGGRTWDKILNVNAKDIKISSDDPNYILVGTERNVFLSTDGGKNFNKQTTGATDKLPDDKGRCEVAIAPTYPNIMYVSKNLNGGEIWRTTNYGATWELMNRGTNYFLSSNGNSQGSYDNALWVNPKNFNYIIVGGIDLWRSRNGGTDLEKISDWTEYHKGNSAHADHHMIVESPNFDGINNKTVYFGNDGGIQKTDDIETVGPTSGWVNLANHLGITQFYGGAATSRKEGFEKGWIFGGTQDNSTLRYKPENGINWYQAMTGDGGYCAVNDETSLFQPYLSILAEFPHLHVIKGQNNGSYYEDAINGLRDAGSSKNALFIAPLINAPNDKSVAFAGGTRIWRSMDNGDNWEKIFLFNRDSSKCSALAIYSDMTSPLYVGYVNGDILRAEFGGNGDWKRIDHYAKGMPNRYVTDIAVSAPRRTEIVVATFGTYNEPNVWISENGGDSWRDGTGTGEFKLPQIPVNTVTLHPYSSHTIYVGTDLGVYASDDLGETWSVVKAYPDNEGPANVEVSDLFWQDDYLIAATHGRGMYRCHPKTVLFVNKDADASDADGSAAHPYPTIQQAINASGNGTIIYIQSETYSEAPIVFDRAGTIIAANGEVIIK